MSEQEQMVPRDRSQEAPAGDAAHAQYDVTALPVTIWFNKDGDHDHNGMMFALTANVPILKYIDPLGKADRVGGDDPPDQHARARRPDRSPSAAHAGAGAPTAPAGAPARAPGALARDG